MPMPLPNRQSIPMPLSIPGQYQCQCQQYQTDNTDIDRGCYAGSNITRLLFANVGSILMRCRFCREHAASSPKGKLCCGGCGRRTITFLNTNSFEKSMWTPSTPSTGWGERRRLCTSIGKILLDNTSLRSVKRDKQRMGNTSTQHRCFSR